MKSLVLCVAAFLAILLLLPCSVMSTRRIGRPRSHHGHHHSIRQRTRDSVMVKPNSYMERRPGKARSDTVQIAGSSLPDCSHACGSCSPCRLVMVSFVCSSLEEAETCPMAYKCMCKNKSYPVP
ncbi:hypothetical protein HHK36_001916 [Tetracentron sinense]|uniref:Epidermal patterning factor-like protein n=1 Tax=Tetracentron sinense TaxID=13715 RepID=A0A834ZYB9_TETSI|nr:hypothetical protein HHK36_001916 [Tetracentron sinense]